MRDSVPRVIERENNTDITDCDDFKQLPVIQQLYILADAVADNRTFVDFDKVCQAELQMLYWAKQRAGKLAAIHRVRALKISHSLEAAGNEQDRRSMAQRGLTDVQSFIAHFANSGIPIMEV